MVSKRTAKTVATVYCFLTFLAFILMFTAPYAGFMLVVFLLAFAGPALVVTWYGSGHLVLRQLRLRRLRQQQSNFSTPNRNIPSNVKQHVWRRDGGRCVQCGSTTNLEYDHDIPVSRGGSNTERNVRILCRSCNRKKHAKIR
jgi:hypothetical protein